MSAIPSLAPARSGLSLPALCRRVRPELAALGEIGAPLLSILAVVESVGNTRGVDALDDPGFALTVAEAVRRYEAGPLAVLAEGTRASNTVLRPSGIELAGGWGSWNKYQPARHCPRCREITVRY